MLLAEQGKAIHFVNWKVFLNMDPCILIKSLHHEQNVSDMIVTLVMSATVPIYFSDDTGYAESFSPLNTTSMSLWAHPLDTMREAIL